MFEITYNDKEILDNFIECGKAYKQGKYDFTFEDRFIIYHTKIKKIFTYIALDTHTGLASKVIDAKTEYTKETYITMIPEILYAIKYTGDRRHINKISIEPYELIDLIFRVILFNNGYKIREEQIELSKKMYNGFVNKQISICEAEVGTGKTLAYLVAAFVARYMMEKEYAILNPITITTSSIELQNVLVEKVIPNLSKMLEEYCIIHKPFNVVLRKGKEHYFCLKRLIDYKGALESDKDKNKELIETLEQLLDRRFILDIDKYNLSSSLKRRICVNGTCEDCKYKTDCGYRRFIGGVYNNCNIDFQVVNHNLYLVAQKNKTEGVKLLQESNFVLIDEAHKFKEAAIEAYGECFSEDDIKTYIKKAKHLCKNIKGEKEYNSNINRLREANKELFEEIYKKVNVVYFEDEKNTVINLSSNDVRKLREIVSLVNIINDNVCPTKKSVLRKGKEIIRKIKIIIHTSENIISLEADENDFFYLKSHPKNIGTILNCDVWNRNVSHVLTSGTMSDGQSFKYFKKENGILDIPEHLILESKTQSPFDYSNHSRLYIPNDLPRPDNDSPRYIKAIAKRINELIIATNGHTAILFTSYKVLRAVYDLLKDKLNKYEVFCMNRGSQKVIAKFKNSKNGILFASGPMWEGVDCAGDCLSSVIIVRLPFPVRSVLLEEKKKEELKTADFIKEYCLSSMLIKLRQGAGRLIRTESDTGVISILDSRANDQGAYKEYVYKALNKYPRINSIEEIKTYIDSIKGESYKE